MLNEPSNPKDPESPTVRDHLEEAARGGSETAIRELASEPECPERYLYLTRMAEGLVGRSGAGFSINPLNPLVAESWARQRGMTLAGYELELLFLFDAVIRHPDRKTELEKEREREENEAGATILNIPVSKERTGAWPQRKIES